jgi:adenosylcobinamide kinase / adenosylcobinamide-phosphate guanylyltransferase
MIHLVLGGARSGKSRFAQQLAEQSKLPVIYIATATALDKEMTARIALHQQDRPSEGQLREAPLDLITALKDESDSPKILLVDCLTLWLNNQLFHFPTQDFNALFNELVIALQQSSHNIILVANEVGLGIIPLGQVSRKFVDEAGRLNQQLAKVADEVSFIAAGLPLSLKSRAK